MSTVRRRAVLAASLVLAIILLPRSALPAQAGDPNVNGAIEQQRRMQAELQRQQAQLASLLDTQRQLGTSLDQIAANLDAAGVAIQDAEDQIAILDDQLMRAQNDLAADRAQLANLQQDLDAVAAQIAVNQGDLQQREALLQDHLRQAYTQSQVSILEVVLSSQSFSDVAGEVSDMLSLSDNDRALIAGIRSAQDQLQVRLATLRDGRRIFTALQQEADARAANLAAQEQRLTVARAQLAAKKAELTRLQAQQQAQLAVTQRDAAAYEQRIAAQEAALTGQAELIAQLKQEADKLDVAYWGRFEWPLQGDYVVTQEFGHTAFEYFHSGIDIAYLHPTCGGPIYAAADGVVLAAGRPNAAYGDTAIGVIIGHSQRLQTWYWHLASEIVEVGQQVHAGDLIGYEGATGWATGCHLHFQVMFDDQPVNPRDYLP